MRVLVAGAAGFIGANVAKRLVDEGYHVFGVDNFSAGHRVAVPDGVELIVEDLAQPDIYQSLPKHIDVILHLIQKMRNFWYHRRETYFTYI